MPRKRTPNHLKVLRGTDRPDRMRPEPAFADVDGYPEPPVEMVNAEATAEWEDKIRALSDAGVLKTTELKALAHYCNLHGKIQELYDTGEMPSGSHLTQLRMMWNEFGLTPASRSKAAPSGESKSDNPFQEMSG